MRGALQLGLLVQSLVGPEFIVVFPDGMTTPFWVEWKGHPCCLQRVSARSVKFWRPVSHRIYPMFLYYDELK